VFYSFELEIFRNIR